ncbi:MAG: cupin domain-containing protein [Acidobacteria bacterium]|nr:cupin domain-containing protein [Acidobacteriota bacterium]
MAVVAVCALNAQDGRLTMRPEDVPWPSARAGGAGTSGAGGIETVILKGDPAKAGLYTILLRAAPNLRIQAHSHRDDRVATVVKGTWLFAYGDTFNEAALKPFGPGSVYTEPPNVAHFAMTKDQVVIQITGTGPSSTTYVDPANDPTRK